MRPLKERVSITLDNDLIAEVKQLAEENERSFSQYVNIVLRKHLNARAKKLEAKTPPPEE